MKYTTNELSGALLDQAVAKAEGMLYDESVDRSVALKMDNPPGTGRPLQFFSICLAARRGEPMAVFAPSTKWEHGGPIIERERIAVVCCRPRFDTNDGGHWDAYFDARYTGPDGQVDCDGDIAEGATPLIAAMRAFVLTKLGDEVDL